MARREGVVRLYDERVCRLREFYLVRFEIGFRYRNIVVYQSQMTKCLDAVLLTRDYILDWECRQTAVKLPF